eukprot:TRINITY_DN6284_c0_g1_i2.p1 TRINITY_DN6284_c0_g1~~TRINITY_DN6284_c0_g1_i2.p1  ORF type:complete len:518 (-),score=86.50 TRINITY_DN6284_c0_g1_i2:780-2333(-)
MRNDSRISFDLSDTGTLYAIGNVANLVGELSAGIITDRIGGRLVYLLSISVPAIMTVIFSFMRSLPLWGLVWGINRLFQSASRPAQASLVGAWFAGSQYGRAWGVLSSSNRFGAALAGIVLSLLIMQLEFTWDMVLIVAGVFLAATALVAAFLLKRRPEDVGLTLGLLAGREEYLKETELREMELQMSDKDRLLDHVDDSDENAAVSDSENADSALTDVDKTPEVLHDEQPVIALVSTRRPLKQTLLIFAREPRFWLMCLFTGCSWVIFEFDIYFPLLFQDVVGVSASGAGLMGAVCPVAMVIAVIAVGFALDKLSRRRGNLLMVFLMAANVLVLAILLLLIHLEALSLPLAVVMNFLYGLTLGVPVYLPMSLFSVRFGGKDYCGTLVALIDCVGWGFIICFDLSTKLFIGTESGWAKVLLMLVLIGAIATVLLAVFMVLDTRVAWNNGRQTWSRRVETPLDGLYRTNIGILVDLRSGGCFCSILSLAVHIILYETAAPSSCYTVFASTSNGCRRQL